MYHQPMYKVSAFCIEIYKETKWQKGVAGDFNTPVLAFDSKIIQHMIQKGSGLLFRDPGIEF